MKMKIKNNLWWLCIACFASSMAWSQTDAFEPNTNLRDRFQFNLQGTYDLADNYILESGMSAQLIYHFRQHFALAAVGTWLFSQGDSTLTRDLRSLLDPSGNDVVTPDDGCIRFQAPYARYYRKPWLISIEAQWTPIVGNMAFHNWELGTFQFFVAAGAGMTGLELRDLNANNALVPLPSSVAFATTVAGGMRLYFGEHFGINIELRDYIQPLVARSTLDFQTSLPSSFYISHSPLLQAGASFVF